MGSLSPPQGIFPTQRSNPGLPHCRQILYQLSHEGSPRILEWVAYPFSSGSSWPKNQTGVSFIAGGFLTNWAIREAQMWEMWSQINSAGLVLELLGYLHAFDYLKHSMLHVPNFVTKFNSVAQLCLTLCDPMDHSTWGLPVHHQLPEFTQTHVHWVSDAIPLSHPLSSPFSPSFNLAQHQGIFQWVSSLHQVAKVL